MAVSISSEVLFQGGIALMAAALFFMIICIVIFSVTGRRLRKQLEEEYGKCNGGRK